MERPVRRVPRTVRCTVPQTKASGCSSRPKHESRSTRVAEQLPIRRDRQHVRESHAAHRDIPIRQDVHINVIRRMTLRTHYQKTPAIFQSTDSGHEDHAPPPYPSLSAPSVLRTPRPMPEIAAAPEASAALSLCRVDAREREPMRRERGDRPRKARMEGGCRRQLCDRAGAQLVEDLHRGLAALLHL